MIIDNITQKSDKETNSYEKGMEDISKREVKSLVVVKQLVTKKKTYIH